MHQKTLLLNLPCASERVSQRSKIKMPISTTYQKEIEGQDKASFARATNREAELRIVVDSVAGSSGQFDDDDAGVDGGISMSFC